MRFIGVVIERQYVNIFFSTNSSFLELLFFLLSSSTRRFTILEPLLNHTTGRRHTITIAHEIIPKDDFTLKCNIGSVDGNTIISIDFKLHGEELTMEFIKTLVREQAYTKFENVIILISQRVYSNKRTVFDNPELSPISESGHDDIDVFQDCLDFEDFLIVK